MHGTLLTTPDTSLCSSTYGCQGQFAMTIGDLLELSRLQVDPSNLGFYGTNYTPPTPSQPDFGVAIVPANHLEHWRCVDNCGGDPTSPLEISNYNTMASLKFNMITAVDLVI